jgi:hypothetical protein
VLVEFEKTTYDQATLAALFGLTFQRPSPGPGGVEDGRAVERALVDSFARPRAPISGARILAAPRSPYAIEILVKGQEQPYRARTPTDDEGLAFVPIRRGEAYAVRLINNSPHEAAVSLTIDGLSMFAFSESKKASRIIVPAGGSTTIRGWHRTDRESNEFLVTEYAKGAAALLKSDPSKVGTITATFAAAWEKKRPEDEPPPPPSAPADDATGLGKKVEVKFTRVNRQVGVTRAAISVRYTK